MNRVTVVFAAVAVAGVALAQEGTRYTPADNPFQGEYAFGPGRPIELYADVGGVRLDTVTLNALQEIRPKESVRCEFQMTGNSVAKKKALLTTVLLLEDSTGRGIERVQLDPFKVKSGKPFDEKQRLDVSGDTLAAAMKVYIFVQIEF
jgi:hypothetical protein